MTRPYYRDNVQMGVRETHWTFWKVLPLGILIITILGGLGFAAKSLGLIGGTVVERVVFENSFQRTEGLKSQLAIYEAALVEMEHILRTTEDVEMRNNMQAQAAAMRVRIAATRSKMQ